MGVAGIALGSLIAEWVAAGAGLMMLISGIGSRPLGAMLKSRLTYEAAKMKALLQTNGYLFLRTLLLIAAFALVTRFSASLGKDALAASHIMTTFLILIALGLDGFAYAVEALSGAAYGRKALQEFKNSVSYGFLWAGAAAIFYSISFYLFGDMLVETLTTIDTVKEQMAILTPMLVVLPLISVWSYQFDGIYVGATASGAMFFTMIFAFAPFALTASYFTEAYGLTGIWGAFIIFLGLRGLTQAFYYPRLKHKLSNPKK